MKASSSTNSIKLVKLTVYGGVVFWLSTIICSLLPIAAEYRAAYSNWSKQIVWIASLPMGLLIGFFVSYILLRYFDKIPSKNPVIKSILISFIVLLIPLVLIDIPQSFFGVSYSPTTLYYFLIGVMLNLLRFLLLGMVIGLNYNDRLKSFFKGRK